MCQNTVPPSGVTPYYVYWFRCLHCSLIKNPAERADLKQLMVSTFSSVVIPAPPLPHLLTHPLHISSSSSRYIPSSNNQRQSRLTLPAGCAVPLDSISPGHLPMGQQCETWHVYKQIPPPPHPKVPLSFNDWICFMGKM